MAATVEEPPPMVLRADSVGFSWFDGKTLHRGLFVSNLVILETEVSAPDRRHLAGLLRQVAEQIESAS